MKIHTEQLYPWADVAKALTTMRRLVVKVGDVTHEGWFDMSQDDAGTVTLAFPSADVPEPAAVTAEWTGTESVEPAEPKARKRK